MATNEEQEEIPMNEDDPEVRKDVSTLSTHTNKRHGLGAERFSRFSSLSSLQHAIANLIVLVKESKRRKVKTHELRERKPVTTKNEVQLLLSFLSGPLFKMYCQYLKLNHLNIFLSHFKSKRK